jgi:hypothetical protein
VADVAAFLDLLVDAEVLERAQRRSGDGDAGPVHPPQRVDVDDVHVDSGAAQRDGRRHATDAGADDEHSHGATRSIDSIT